MTRGQRSALVAAILGSGVASIDGTIVNVALPAIQADLGGGLISDDAIAGSGLGVVPAAARQEKRFEAAGTARRTSQPPGSSRIRAGPDGLCGGWRTEQYEREANQAAVEILFQGGQATDEFDSSAPSLDEICFISELFGASIVATARYVVETSRRPIAVAIAHVNPKRGFGPTHVYASKRFEGAFRWQAGGAPWNEVRAALRTAHMRTMNPGS